MKAHRTASRGRLLFVCEVFHPDQSSTSQLFTAVFESSEFCGVPVTVVANRTPAASASAVPAHFASDVEVIRTGVAIDGKKSVARRLVRYAAFVVGATVSMLVRPQDRILGLTNPPFTAVWLWLLTRITRQKYDLFLLDLYPEGLEGLGALSPRSIVARTWRWFNERAYRRAGKLVVLGRDMAARVAAEYGLPMERIIVFPHWSPFDQDAPIAFSESELVASRGLADRFVVQYSGNMGIWHDIDSLIRAAALLSDVAKLTLLFIGGGARRKHAEALCRELGVTNVSWLEFQPLDRLADSLAACHMAIISQREGLDGVAVPCKMYGILASGRAILAAVPATSEVAQVVEEEHCGVVAPPSDPVALAAAIRRIAQDPDAANAMGRRAFQAYKTKYTTAIAAKRFRDIWGAGPG